MKKVKLILTALFILFLSAGIMAQTDPPDPPGEHGSNEDQQGRAPISGGVLILLGFAVVYGVIKVVDYRKEKRDLPI